MPCLSRDLPRRIAHQACRRLLPGGQQAQQAEQQWLLSALPELHLSYGLAGQQHSDFVDTADRQNAWSAVGCQWMIILMNHLYHLQLTSLLSFRKCGNIC